MRIAKPIATIIAVKGSRKSIFSKMKQQTKKLFSFKKMSIAETLQAQPSKSSGSSLFSLSFGYKRNNSQRSISS